MATQHAPDVIVGPFGEEEHLTGDEIEDSSDSEYDSPLTDLSALNGYSHFDKGCIEGSQTIAACDLDFLFAILDDLDLMFDSFWKGDLICIEDQEMWEKGFKTIMDEVVRLATSPSLVPDVEIRETFFEYVESFCESFESSPRMPPDTEVIKKVNEILYRRHRASYDPKRTSWHQFLHHYAPGSNSVTTQPRGAREAGSRQIIPPGGIRLLRGWERDIRSLQQDIFPNKEPETYRGILKAAAHKEHALGGKSRYKLIGVIPQGPTYMNERSHFKFQSLETLSRDYARLDTDEDDAEHLRPEPYMYIADCRQEEWIRWKLMSRSTRRSSLQNHNTQG